MRSKKKHPTPYEERAHCQDKLTVTHQRINHPTGRPQNTATRQCTEELRATMVMRTTFLLPSSA
jgi:hypothetical protein